jgi:hypothetical protein
MLEPASPINYNDPNQVRALVIKKVIDERERQDKKFGAMPRNLKPSLWLAILTEETGEVARAILEGDSDNYAVELIQVAAVAIAALEDYYRGQPLQDVDDVCPPIRYFGE